VKGQWISLLLVVPILPRFGTFFPTVISNPCFVSVWFSERVNMPLSSHLRLIQAAVCSTSHFFSQPAKM
jgi:hypothetical protein